MPLRGRFSPGAAAAAAARERVADSRRARTLQVNGKEKTNIALTKIRGVGRRFATLCCKKADVDLNKRCVARPLA